MNSFQLNSQRAEEFVKALFEVILHRRVTTEAETKYWTDELLGGRGPCEILRAFATCDEAIACRDGQLRHATFYPHGHFYSPVVNVEEIKARDVRVFDTSPPLAVDLRDAEQLELLDKLVPFFDSIPFHDDHRPPHRYYFNNTSFGFGDACFYWSMIGHFRPNKIIEIGSGFTSALALDAISHYRLPTVCTFIDPFPKLLQEVAGPIPSCHTVVADMVQDVPLILFEQLGENDFLFIDSSHVVKSGSDVHFEITKVLPRLRSGVVIHFHDIFYPFEYPREWVLKLNYSWNELYTLQTFLMYNSAFEVLFFNDYISKQHHKKIRSVLPANIASRIEINPGGGLWLRRK